MCLWRQCWLPSSLCQRRCSSYILPKPHSGQRHQDDGPLHDPPPHRTPYSIGGDGILPRETLDKLALMVALVPTVTDRDMYEFTKH